MIYFYLIALVVSVLAEPQGKITIDNKNRVVRDADGRHIIFHGVNVVYKVAPYIPDQSKSPKNIHDSLNATDIADLKSWGFNLVRLGVMWEAVERAPGVYNETYIEEINDLINKLGEQGIYTLVDDHQDLLSRSTCGEGMPNFYAREILAKSENYCFGPWADYFIAPLSKHFGACKSIEDYGFRKDADGNPLIEDCMKNFFGMYYTTPEVQTLFRAIYQNELGMQDKYVAYWEFVSNKLSSNPYVIGFDPFNEPSFFAAKNFKNFMYTLWPGHFDKYDLAPMYKKVFNKYKAANPENIMYFEPTQFPDTILKYVFDLGFSTPPGGEIASKNHVLNDHDYCCMVFMGECENNSEPTPQMADKCLGAHEKRIGTRNEDAKRLGIPFLLSEFGACIDADECATEIRQIGDVSDKYLNGWAYWQFKTFEDLTTAAGTTSEGFYNVDGSLQWKKVKALTRTYVKHSQGQTLSMNFDSATTEFQALIKVDTSISAPTEIHASIEQRFDQTILYPKGVDVQLVCDEDPNAIIQVNGNVISITIGNPKLDGQNVLIKVTPKE